ncbi:ribonuclease pancreatic-like [Erythrolamprus reginae]|uniref:ribonuclease pancreatic-like n=1 Tax=Erythrolamprus reginae TaxID=121349 RepID=UPI00396C3A60
MWELMGQWHKVQGYVVSRIRDQATRNTLESLYNIFLESPTMLASKISCLLVVSLAFLLGALLVMPSQGQTWADFQRKHIDYSQYPPTNPRLYCENMMRARGMTNPFCKPHNTFINAPVYTVERVCQYIKGPSATTSVFNFNLVDCWNTGGLPPCSCNYQALVLSARIRVTCDDYVPVHFSQIVPQAKK